MLPVKRILWPTDFSDPSFLALESATELAAHFEAELVCVHVLVPPPENSEWADASKMTIPLSVQEDRNRLRTDLNEKVKARCPAGVECRTIVVIGDAPEAIIDVAGNEDVDLLVTATHGRTGWRRMVFGSVAEKVIREAPCPVLTIRAPEEQNSEE